MDDNGFPRVRTGNGFQNDLIATTNDRLERQILTTRELHDSIKELNGIISNFAATADKQTGQLIKLTASIKTMNQEASKQTNKLVKLTVWIVVLTVILVIGLIVQVIALITK
jgi:hypothetical protein